MKAFVDVQRGLLALDAGMHSDLEALLLDAGSRQADLWGINLRPGQGNRTRSVDDPDARDSIEAHVGREVVP